MAFLQPVLAVGALAVDPQLTLPDDALDVGERQAGKARLEEAVDAHVVLVSSDDDGLDFCRQRQLGLCVLGLDRHWSRLVPPRLGEACGLAALTMRRRAIALRS